MRSSFRCAVWLREELNEVKPQGMSRESCRHRHSCLSALSLSLSGVWVSLSAPLLYGSRSHVESLPCLAGLPVPEAVCPRPYGCPVPFVLPAIPLGLSYRFLPTVCMTKIRTQQDRFSS